MRRIRKRLRIAPVLVASKKASGAWSNAAAIRLWSSRDARREQSVRRT
jgi:hypothetical protein